MKSLFTLIAVLCLTSAVFATNGNETNTPENGTEPTGSTTEKTLPEDEVNEEENVQMTLFNFSLFTFMTVDSVPTISTFGGTDRFRKATCTPH